MSRCPNCNVQYDPNRQYKCENCGELFWRSKKLFEEYKKTERYKQKEEKIEGPHYKPIKLNLSSEEKDLMSQLFNHAIVSLAEGNTKETIIYDFIKNGIPKENAEIIIAEANSAKKSIFRQSGRWEIIFGIFLLVLGVIFALIAFKWAESSDMNYVKVPGGAIVIGAIAIIHGTYRSIMG